MRWYLFSKIAGTVCIGVALWFGYLMFDNSLRTSQWKRSGDQRQVAAHRDKSIYRMIGFIVFFMPGVILVLQEKPKP